MLQGDRSRAVRLKGWDFTCRIERGTRGLRVILARAAKRHGQGLNQKEMAAEADERVEDAVSGPSGSVPRKRVSGRKRFGPHILVRVWGSGHLSLWVMYAGHASRDDLKGFLEGLREPRPLWPEAPQRNLGARLLDLFARNPGLQARGLPLRFLGGMPLEPLDGAGQPIPGVAGYLDHTGKRLPFRP